MTAIPALIERHARERVESTYCTFLAGGEAKTITFGALYRGAQAYAAEFLRRGVGRGDIVPIILRHSPHLLYSFIGAMLAGAIPTFMPFPSTKQRTDLYWKDHEELFARLRPRIIVTYEENLAAAQATLTTFSIDTLLATDALLGEFDDAGMCFPGLSASPHDVACLQHSSGTTGLKKGVMLSHEAILAQVDAYSRAIALRPQDSIVSWLPLYHDMGFIACFLTSILAGVSLVALDPFEWVLRPPLLLDAIQRYRPTLCWLPNFAFSHIVRTTRASAEYDLSSVRAFINCSEPCKALTFERFLERFAISGVRRESLQVCYAMAENVFAVSQTDCSRPAKTLAVDADSFFGGTIAPSNVGRASLTLSSCGRLIDGVGVEIRDSSGERATAGIIGEIHVSSPFLFSGYYLQPDITNVKLRDGWYATGDMGFVHADELYVAGRVDDMLIINGRNYYAHEIEVLVNAVPGVIPGRSIALGIDDARLDATVLVVLVEHRGEPADAQRMARAIRADLLEHLGLAAQAVNVLAAGSLVKTTSGKISRVKNKEFYLAGTFENIPVEL